MPPTGTSASVNGPREERRISGTKRRRVNLAARGGVAVALVALILLVVQRTGDEMAWSPGLIPGIVGAGGFILAAQLLGAVRWKLILGAGSPRWPRLARLYLGAAFFSVFLPSSAGGDAYRAAAISRLLGHIPNGMMSVFVDRAFGLGALGVWFLVGVAIFAVTGTEYPSLAGMEVRWPLVVSLLGAGVTAGLFVLRSKQPRVAALRQVVRSAATFVFDNVSTFRGLLTICFVSMVVQGFYILAWVALADGAGIPLSPSFLMLTVPVVSVVAMLPVTISGLGLREGVWVLVTRGLGVPMAGVVVFSLSYFVAFALVGLVGGVLLFRNSGPGFEAEAGGSR